MSELVGKIIILGKINVLTGLRVGGSSGGLKIGGVDLNVITDPLGAPYIPGSSLKGKTRSLMERFHKTAFNEKGIHLCQTTRDYERCPVCKIWGTLGDVKKINVPTLTRLYISDVYLDPESITKSMRDNMELQWTEVKFETAINRISGTALQGSLRQVERVPAGAVFHSLHMVFNVFGEEDKSLLKNVFIALELLEHDYLGGMGSRGYGRVAFSDLMVFWNPRAAYETGNVALTPERVINAGAQTAPLLVRDFSQILERLT